RHGDFDGESGAEGAGALLDLADPPTAIFATSDNLALGALRAARSRDVAVPERLSVIGFDDTMVTRWTTPQLTAVSQPLASMGQV
ncbi:substrate-binding domain-containing protein, partial [Pseudomonas sp. PNPG3]|uniref:substrate-binding domain-containing protein n=1 Tax=Pseudomonas sp. PNPG3 TaxID=2919497 RepID=UPI001FFD50A2